MLSTNSSPLIEIGHGQLRYEIEETEGSRGSGGTDHLVAGVAPATMAAAAGGGARRPRLREGEREREETHPGQELTPEAMARTARHGEGRRRCCGARPSSVGRGEDGFGGGDGGAPETIKPAGRRSTTRRG